MKNTLLVFSLTFFCFLAVCQPRPAVKPVPKKTRILFVLDGSGSMLASWEGRARILTAKDVLSNMVDSLATLQNVQTALRVYGHQFDRKHKNCGDTKLEVGFYPNNADKIKERLGAIKPKGVTPIARTLERAAYDFMDDPNYRNVIIIITDGIESCDGDPCAISQALQKKHIFLQPFIIGLGMDLNVAEQFNCMGKFRNAATIDDFKSTLSEIVDRSLSKAFLRVDLLDINDKPLETNVNMSFVNHLTGQTEYDLVHYIKENGNSDEIEMDPVIQYDIVVNTLPKVVKRNIDLGKEHNIIKIKCPQGVLMVSQLNHQQYKNLQFIIRKKGSKEVIHHGTMSEKINLLVGKYDIEVLTTPRVKKTIQIKQDMVEKFSLQTPGILNIKDNFVGFASIYKITADGSDEWVQNLTGRTVQTSMAIQPGSYKIVVRSKNAPGVIYTITKEFTIKPGASTNLSLL